MNYSLLDYLVKEQTKNFLNIKVFKNILADSLNNLLWKEPRKIAIFILWVSL